MLQVVPQPWQDWKFYIHENGSNDHPIKLYVYWGQKEARLCNKQPWNLHLMIHLMIIGNEIISLSCLALLILWKTIIVMCWCYFKTVKDIQDTVTNTLPMTRFYKNLKTTDNYAARIIVSGWIFLECWEKDGKRYLYTASPIHNWGDQETNGMKLFEFLTGIHPDSELLWGQLNRFYGKTLYHLYILCTTIHGEKQAKGPVRFLERSKQKV